MKKAGRPKLDGTLPVKVHIDAALVEWLDRESTRRKRSRSYLINELLQRRMLQLERRRKKPRKES